MKAKKVVVVVGSLDCRCFGWGVVVASLTLLKTPLMVDTAEVGNTRWDESVSRNDVERGCYLVVMMMGKSGVDMVVIVECRIVVRVDVYGWRFGQWELCVE